MGIGETDLSATLSVLLLLLCAVVVVVVVVVVFIVVRGMWTVEASLDWGKGGGTRTSRGVTLSWG